jgi:hypothetical protein
MPQGERPSAPVQVEPPNSLAALASSSTSAKVPLSPAEVVPVVAPESANDRHFGAQISGVVSQYLTNPQGRIEGVLLTDGTQVRYAPQVDADFARTIRVNEKISAQGDTEKGHAFRALTISDLASRSTVAETRKSAVPLPSPADRVKSELKPLKAEGSIAALLSSPQGEPDGMVLDSKTIVRFPPEAAQRLVNLLTVGQKITAKGLGTENEFGCSIEAAEIGAPGQAPIVLQQGLAAF